MKGLMKACSGGSAMCRGWRVIGLPGVYLREYAGSHSVGRPQKRWIDNMKESLWKRARRMVQDRSEWWGFVRRECMRCSPGDESMTLMKCHSYMKPLKGGGPSVAKPTT